MWETELAFVQTAYIGGTDARQVSDRIMSVMAIGSFISILGAYFIIFLILHPGGYWPCGACGTIRAFSKSHNCADTGIMDGKYPKRKAASSWYKVRDLLD